MSEPFTVLIVCVANVCRSPLAEEVLHARLNEALGELSEEVTVESAGANAVLGAPMDGMAALELGRLGLLERPRAARQLTDDMVAEADLVLTASKDLRAHVLALTPSALRRTFTITEFAALVEGQGAGSPDALVADAVRRRSGASVPTYDIPDPRGRGSRAHRRSADLIDKSMASIAPALAAAVRARVAGQAV